MALPEGTAQQGDQTRTQGPDRSAWDEGPWGSEGADHLLPPSILRQNPTFLT